MARTILLADDSVTIQKVVELTFLDEDFRVVSYGNGDEAIAALADLRPDVVLADVHMPGSDGYAVCAAARDAVPGVPVLLLVGTFEVFDAQRADAVGAAGHLKKPFDSQELLRQVQELAASAETAAAPSAVVAPEASPEIVASEADADEGASWSFEPAGSEPEAAASGEIAADTWGGVDPAQLEESAAEPEPVAVEASEAEAAPGQASEEAAASEHAGESVGVPARRELSDDEVDRIARRVVELIGDKAVRDVAWEVVPDLAEILLKSRIRELEASVE